MEFSPGAGECFFLLCNLLPDLSLSVIGEFSSLTVSQKCGRIEREAQISTYFYTAGFNEGCRVSEPLLSNKSYFTEKVD